MWVNRSVDISSIKGIPKPLEEIFRSTVWQVSIVESWFRFRVWTIDEYRVQEWVWDKSKDEYLGFSLIFPFPPLRCYDFDLCPHSDTNTAQNITDRVPVLSIPESRGRNRDGSCSKRQESLPSPIIFRYVVPNKTHGHFWPRLLIQFLYALHIHIQFFVGHFWRCLRRLFSPDEIPPFKKW